MIDSNVYQIFTTSCALNDVKPEIGVEAIKKLMEIVDTHIPEPTRDLTSPFLLSAEGSFQVNRGVVCSGRIERGVIKKGDACEVIGKGKRIKSSVVGKWLTPHSSISCTAEVGSGHIAKQNDVC